MNIAFLASHNGSSAKAITDACFNDDIKASPTLMISNNAKSKALEWSADKGLKTICLNEKTQGTIENLDQAIAQKLIDEKIKLVICSGYMKLIGPETIHAVHGHILNMHPSLLPAYGGKGMYGSRVHEAVKAANEEKTGITIHLVSHEFDKGRIIAQKEIALTQDESALDIEEKVKAAEPDFYIKTIQKILSGELNLS